MIDQSDYEDECDCLCHLIERSEYRVMLGNESEGLSMREVFYDDKDNILGWSDPLQESTSSVQQVTMGLVNSMKTIDEMLDATKKPILNEVKLQQTLELG